MRKSLLSLLLACYAALAFSQLNMTLTDQIDYTPQVSSLWGYIDPEDGTEYAAVGVATGLSVVDLTDPYNIQEIAFVPDVNSIWREVKSYGHYIYAVTEGGGGLLVVNMTDPTNVTSTHWAPNIPGLGVLNKIHSITVDEFGFLYLNGSSLNAGGPLIVDVSADNGLPVYVGKLPAIYCHDSYARDNKIYTSDIYAGNFKVYDITDKANPILLATQQTPFNFTHNTWLNDAGTVIFTTDEKANAPVGVYDISDLDNIVELDQFRPVATIGQGTIPHNVHVWNDWVVTAYYTNGTIIVDGSRPENMIEVGNFDSFVTNPSGFYGVWGVYPYFPSGLVIASDMQNGLLVYDVNYVRACWLEGKTTNAITGAAVSNAQVSIASTQPNAGTSDLTGNYKTGQAIPGTFDVTFTATGYFPKTVPATLENGVLTTLDVKLEPLVINPFPPFSFTAPTSGCAPMSIDFFENSDVVASWAWTFENGNPATSTEQNPSVQFTVPGFHDVSLQVTTMGGNTYTVTNNDLVVIAASPVASFTSTVDVLTVNFINTSTNFNNLIWDFGDGNTSTATNPQHTYHDVGSYTVTLTLFGDCGTDMFTQTVTTDALEPIAAFGSNVTVGCAPLTVSFFDQSQNAPTAWSWGFNGGNPAGSVLQNPTVTYANAGSYPVLLNAINTAGNDLIIVTNYITVSENSVANFSTTIDGPEVLFLNTSTGTNNGYSWDFGDGQSSDEESPLHVYAAPGTYNVYLTINSICGTSTYMQTVTIAEFLPTAGFNANITTGCAPLTVAFTDQSTGGPNLWLWTFSGGSPGFSNLQNPTVTYNTPGVYSPLLTVGNNYGISELSLDNLITVNGAPIADFYFSVNGNVASFANNSDNALTYSWAFNDGSGTNSTDENPSHTFPGPGTYEVVLTATNGCGPATYAANVVIASTAPTAAFSVDVAGNCAPVQVLFADQSAGGPTAWAWSFPGGTPATSSEQNPTVSYTEAGVYSATLIVTNSVGSSESTMTNFVTVGAAPQTSFTVVQNGLNASFSNASVGATSYAWDFGDGNTSTVANPAHAYAENGTFTVVLTATNACGTSTFEQEIVVSVAAPSANFIGSQAQGCAPLTVDFTDQSTGLVTGWAWSFPGGTPATSTMQNPSVVYANPGAYDITLVVTGPGGSDTIESLGQLSVDDVPASSFTFTTNGGFTATFQNTSDNALSYVWDFGDGNTSTEENPIYTYGSVGTYEVTLTATNGCGSTEFSQTVVVNVAAIDESVVAPFAISASPNPFTGQLWVKYELKNSFEKAAIVATNMLGEVVAEMPVKANSGNLRFTDNFGGSGVYFLRLVVDGQAGDAVKVVKIQ